MSDLLNTIITLAFGSLLGFFLGFLKLRHETKLQAKNVAAAFYGEIDAVLEVGLKKENVNYLQKLITHFGQGEFYPFYISFKTQYFKVYAENAGNLGFLTPPNPELISKFYIYSSAILDELETVNTYIEKGQTNEFTAKRVEEIYELFCEAARIGIRCRERLKSDYKVGSQDRLG